MENNIDKGFVKLKRNMLDWEWYQDGNTVRLMIHLLLRVNYTTNNWQGIQINPGELITSFASLSKELGLSENIIRTSLQKLIKTKYISKKSSSKYTRITILNSIIYDSASTSNHNQNNGQLTNQSHTNHEPITNQSRTNHKPITTNKKEKKEEEIIERKEVFKKQIFQFQNQFSVEKLTNFFKYWSEENKQTGRMKFEDENYWEIENRLSNWKEFTKDLSKKTSNNFYINR